MTQSLSVQKAAEKCAEAYRNLSYEQIQRVHGTVDITPQESSQLAHAQQCFRELETVRTATL